MPKLTERGAIQFIIILILLAGVAVGVWLITSGPLKIFPKATISGPVGPTTSFALSPNVSSVKAGDIFGVKVVARSDIAASNLFKAEIDFNKNLLTVDRIDYEGTFIKNWVEQYSNNGTGEISLTGGVPNPGIQTSSSSAALPMAVIYFKALAAGSANISFTDDSAIYSNADNVNILTATQPLSLNISGVLIPPSPPPPLPSIPPSPSPTGSPPATPTPVFLLGDGNNDGNINLVDLSVLLSDFNKNQGFRTEIDLNGDGAVNTFDFALMKNLLIQKGVIRGL